MAHSDIAKNIHQAALLCGFENCGVIPLEHLESAKEHFQERIRKVPSSADTYKPMEALTEPKKRFPWAKSLVICTYWYGKYRFPKELQGRYAKTYFLSPEEGRTDGYNLGRLEQWFADQGIRAEGGNQFGHISIGPLRHAAAAAGLGIIRKNNFFYTEKGSYYGLIGYAIDRQCELIYTSNLKPCSKSCTLCQEACKTKALEAPYAFAPGKCVSFWTTFGKGQIPPFLREEMLEEWLCGCDNCQDACPHNRKHDWSEGEDFSNLAELAPRITPERILDLPDDFLVKNVIPKTDHHMESADVPVLRENAKRALRFREKNIEK